MTDKRFLALVIISCLAAPLFLGCPISSGFHGTIEWQADQQGYVQFMTNETSSLDTAWYAIYPPAVDPMNTSTVTAVKNSGDPEGGFGMIFCAYDLDNFYRVLVTASGYFNVYRKTNGYYYRIQDWTKSSALKTDKGVLNLISVTNYGGGQFTVYFNGRSATSFNDYTFTGGRTGFYAYVSDAETFPSVSVDVRFRLTRPINATVSTFAGSTGSSGSTDSTGSSARFSSPKGIVANGGYLYVADEANSTIRRIEIATADVETFAGAAGIGGSADGDVTDARFTGPRGIATDGTNLYVTDMSNYTIRQIATATTQVTTLAGLANNKGYVDGTGSDARFSEPWGIAAAGGNLYVTDASKHTIRKIVVSTGAVTTFAGSPGVFGSTDGVGTSARFYWPTGIATDGSSLYLCDSLNQTIRTVDIATGEVTTLAGSAGEPGWYDGFTSDARFDTPQGISLSGPNLHVTDNANFAVRMIELATGVVTTLAGRAFYSGATDDVGPLARFNSPWEAAASGDALFITDDYDHTVRRILIWPSMAKTILSVAPSPQSLSEASSLRGPKATDSARHLPVEPASPPTSK